MRLPQDPNLPFASKQTTDSVVSSGCITVSTASGQELSDPKFSDEKRHRRYRGYGPTIWKYLYRVPICGGFCAPTQSPEKSALRHFSNEKTVICYFVFWKLLRVLEQNKVCYRIGAIGMQTSRRQRKIIMASAFVIASLCAALIVFSIAGNSTNAATLRIFPWAQGSGSTKNANGEVIRSKYYIGILQRIVDVEMSRAHYNEIIDTMRKQVDFESDEKLDDDVYRLTFAKPWEDGCEFADPDFQSEHRKRARRKMTSEQHRHHHHHDEPKYCEGCYEDMTTSIGFMIMLFVSQLATIYSVVAVAILINVPTIATDCQRITEFGDLNCQKFFGAFCSLIGIYGCFDGVMKFYHGCYAEAPETLALHEFPAVKLKWELGRCWHFFMWAGVLKIVDCIFHFLVQTPPGRHVRIDPAPDSLGDFMQNVDPPFFGDSIPSSPPASTV
eukprot:GEMP01045608.1.p1 GENE.GEMP01045608.1~~GEMP01045608.1.p1  ORF type:complete len:442 (+),score=56.12 GEMP01045608.1:88-1413(+)